ncbi:hypothetical protein TRFO_38648 [Tritrichomonas foetus]|uniref:DNA/RNA-binding protein Kin17 WH-like domain-containing protein n=1 Tax=Tritrichomonas foetus TaxID=1144522 RepID=A0A1J4J8W1_9EUKA|nr:hypothetical protein TRFO_38648 [Tritrichomonas foetus]|eukprot:OHS95129.1 hypothetical protein TRFO_38648 [Tritrichomonas foetus]
MGKKKNLTECKIISKKSKYGQLQKLKWYCEICQHQCNDEHSFRHHVQCEKHRIMMSHFRANSQSILRQNSHIFECVFMDCLRRQYPNREVSANTVYTQVIRDKKHVHLNSTFWDSVHGFCRHLANNGKIEIRETERGPMIKYIAKDSDNLVDESLIETFEQQKVAEIQREKEIVKKMLQTKSNETQSKDIEFVEPQKIDSVVVKDVKKTEKKVSSLFSVASRPKVKEDIK